METFKDRQKKAIFLFSKFSLSFFRKFYSQNYCTTYTLQKRRAKNQEKKK